MDGFQMLVRLARQPLEELLKAGVNRDEMALRFRVVEGQNRRQNLFRLRTRNRWRQRGRKFTIICIFGDPRRGGLGFRRA